MTILLPMSNIELLLFFSPVILVAVAALLMMRAVYGQSRLSAAPLSGYKAARQILDSAGLPDVPVRQTPGYLSDYYDMRRRVLRLSEEVYHGRDVRAIGIAAHEAGHAVQHSRRSWPLAIRVAAVTSASYGSTAGILLMLLGLMVDSWPLSGTGAALFASVLTLQFVNLIVELNANRHTARQLAELHLLDDRDLPMLRRVLNAAALTYIAGSLHAVLAPAYHLLHYLDKRR